MPADTFKAPFTPEQVRLLNQYQERGYFHPFTCRTDQHVGRPLGRPALIATGKGWTCPLCDYTQDWAWKFMADQAWFDKIEAVWAKVHYKGEINVETTGPEPAE